jgi:PBS lyase HEAT-like repeat-containing protein
MKLRALLLVLAWSLMGWQDQNTVAKTWRVSNQTTKQSVVDAISELYPQISGTAEEPHVTKPGGEVGIRIQKKLLDIANESPEIRDLVVRTLVDLLENPSLQDGFYYSTVWGGACPVLGHLKAEEAIDVMSNHLDMQNGPLTLSSSRFPAVQGLIQIGEPAVQALEKALRSTGSKATCRGLAAFALGAIGGEQAKDALKRGYKQETDPRSLEGD